MMVVLSSSISSRSLRASSCICIRSCCSLVMYSMVFCSVMAWLVWGVAGLSWPAAPSRDALSRHLAARGSLTCLELLEIKLLRVLKPILILKRLFCSAEMCFCRFCGDQVVTETQARPARATGASSLPNVTLRSWRKTGVLGHMTSRGQTTTQERQMAEKAPIGVSRSGQDSGAGKQHVLVSRQPDVRCRVSTASAYSPTSNWCGQGGMYPTVS